MYATLVPVDQGSCGASSGKRVRMRRARRSASGSGGKRSVNGAGVRLADSAMAREILLVWERTKVRSLDRLQALRFLTFVRNDTCACHSKERCEACPERSRREESRSLHGRSKSEVRQPRMLIRPPSERPAKQTLFFLDRQIVDAGKPPHHVTGVVELPIFVAVATKPVVRVVVPLVREPHRDARSGARPQVLDQPVVEFPGPLALQKRAHFGAAGRKFAAVAPARVLGVDEHDPIWVARI